MTKTHYHPSLLFSDQQYVKGACGLRGRCPLSAASAKRPRIWMNIKFEFQLRPRYHSMSQPHPRCACPPNCPLYAWTDHGLGSSPCLCLTTSGGDLCCHHGLCSAAWLGWDSVLPPRALPTLLRPPLTSSLLLPGKAFAGPTWANRRYCWCHHTHQYPRNSFIQGVPWPGDRKLTSG